VPERLGTGSGMEWILSPFLSGTTKDLVAGSGIAFEERGAHVLKGVPGDWHLYRASVG